MITIEPALFLTIVGGFVASLIGAIGWLYLDNRKLWEQVQKITVKAGELSLKLASELEKNQLLTQQYDKLLKQYNTIVSLYTALKTQYDKLLQEYHQLLEEFGRKGGSDHHE